MSERKIRGKDLVGDKLTIIYLYLIYYKVLNPAVLCPTCAVAASFSGRREGRGHWCPADGSEFQRHLLRKPSMCTGHVQFFHRQRESSVPGVTSPVGIKSCFCVLVIGRRSDGVSSLQVLT